MSKLDLKVQTKKPVQKILCTGCDYRDGLAKKEGGQTVVNCSRVGWTDVIPRKRGMSYQECPHRQLQAEIIDTPPQKKCIQAVLKIVAMFARHLAEKKDADAQQKIGLLEKHLKSNF